MRRLMLLALVLFLGATGVLMRTEKQSESRQLKEAFLLLTDRLIELGLHQIDCPSFYDDDPYEFRACFGLKNTPESFISTLDKNLLSVATRTVGWQQDYGSWGAFYRLAKNRHIRFGISLTAKEIDPELEKHLPLRDFYAFGRVTVVETED